MDINRQKEKVRLVGHLDNIVNEPLKSSQGSDHDGPGNESSPESLEP